jgi:hypothetical protein
MEKISTCCLMQCHQAAPQSSKKRCTSIKLRTLDFCVDDNKVPDTNVLFSERYYKFRAS